MVSERNGHPQYYGESSKPLPHELNIVNYFGMVN
jgi:hypothetical protein